MSEDLEDQLDSLLAVGDLQDRVKSLEQERDALRASVAGADAKLRELAERLEASEVVATRRLALFAGKQREVEALNEAHKVAIGVAVAEWKAMLEREEKGHGEDLANVTKAWHEKLEATKRLHANAVDQLTSAAGRVRDIEAQAAAMRAALEAVSSRANHAGHCPVACGPCETRGCPISLAYSALSTDAGRGWLSPALGAAIRQALFGFRALIHTDDDPVLLAAIDRVLAEMSAAGIVPESSMASKLRQSELTPLWRADPPPRITIETHVADCACEKCKDPALSMDWPEPRKGGEGE